MSTPTELRLAAEKDEAMQAVLDSLPKDAVVRDEDDGVGRFAGQRTVAVISRNRGRLLLFEGTWGDLKPRIDKAQVEVAFETVPQGVVARITAEEATPPGVKDFVLDVISQSVTVAALVAAYHLVRSMPVDYGFLAMVGVGGGVAWSVVARFLPKKEKPGLDDKVRRALEPLEAVAEAGDAAGDEDDE